MDIIIREVYEDVAKEFNEQFDIKLNYLNILDITASQARLIQQSIIDGVDIKIDKIGKFKVSVGKKEKIREKVGYVIENVTHVSTEQQMLNLKSLRKIKSI